MFIEKAELLELIARVLLTAPFSFSAIWKAQDFPGAVLEMKQLGLPLPAITAAVTIIVQAACSAGIIFDAGTIYCALALIAFTLIASIAAHPFWRVAPENWISAANSFVANVGLVGGLLLVILIS
ncbi:MAG: DoxX family protein [Pseudomonadota bacterium]